MKLSRLGICGIISLLSYTAMVCFSPLAYPGYDWMSQAVSDLSADTASSLMLWKQLTALYGSCGLVSIMAVCIYVSVIKVGNKVFRTGIYLFAIMNWISSIGYEMFPLSKAGKEIKGFQNIMHVYVITAAVVVTSIVSLILIIVGGFRKTKNIETAIWAAIALAMMFIGAIGTGAVPKQYFGIVERFSVFAAVGFDMVLSIQLLRGTYIKQE
ncbi:MAG TPA: DUF998 domain-containing protein [Lachnospiraceae bacterium]|nr:DUF998 domain-containing protein [Lachnospiraceae bacterium]